MGRLPGMCASPGSGSATAAAQRLVVTALERRLRLLPWRGASRGRSPSDVRWCSCPAAALLGATRRSMPSPRRCSPDSRCWIPVSSQRLGSAGFGGGGCMSRLARQSGQVKLPARLCCSQATRQEVCMAWEQGSCLPACSAGGGRWGEERMPLSTQQHMSMPGTCRARCTQRKVPSALQLQSRYAAFLRADFCATCTLPAHLHAAQADAAGASLQLLWRGIREGVAQAVLEAAVRRVLRQAAAQGAQRVPDIQEEHPVDELQLEAVQPPADGQGEVQVRSWWTNSAADPCAPHSISAALPGRQ